MLNFSIAGFINKSCGFIYGAQIKKAEFLRPFSDYLKKQSANSFSTIDGMALASLCALFKGS